MIRPPALRALAVLALLCAGGCARTANAPPPAPKPASFRIEQHRLGVDADGNARWLLIARFYDASGQVVRMLSNTDLDWRSRDGTVQWQTRMRFGQPSAIVRTTRDGSLHATVRANVPRLGSVSLVTDTRTWNASRAVATALGPYAVQIGWFPQQNAVRVVRSDPSNHQRSFVVSGSSFRDTGVRARERYRYDIFDARGRATLFVTTPAPPQGASIDALRGIGMWLSFSNNPIDPDYATRWDSAAIVAHAVRAHLRFVELRTAYGEFFEVTPDVRATVDAVIDGLAARGIATIAWTVPRDTKVEDLGATIASAYYRTQRGTPMRGLAVDLERGDEFMGNAAGGTGALWTYVRSLREALGPRYPIVATVEDPYFGHLDNASYPYARIAAEASAMQPMSYWRMMRRTPPSAADVRAGLVAAVARLRSLSGSAVPVSIGGQTAAEGRNGPPPPEDLAASVEAAREASALGICYFDYAGTTPEQWTELEKLKY